MDLEIDGDFSEKVVDPNLKRPRKKKKLDDRENLNHPHGVLPLGNMYTASTNCRYDSLGYFGILEDDTIIEILGLISSTEVAILSGVSKVFYVFANLESVWKNHYLNDYPAQINYYRNWKKTYILARTGKLWEVQVPITVSGFFSDSIYNEWYLTTIDPLQWCNIDNIQRENNLSLEDFKKKYEEPGIPVIINDVIPRWPAFEKWTDEYVLKEYGETLFQAGTASQSLCGFSFVDTKISYKLGDYLSYCNQNNDERPIYIFASDFLKQAPKIESEYEVPIYFRQDYFNYIQNKRPNFRWLLVGPKRAGATFHKDPNWTSAWNGLISGKKKWIFYPPDVSPLGVIESAGGLEVTVPETLIQWFNDFYAKKHLKRIECIQYPVYVPSGWWHQVINLETSIAITHNFVNDNNLKKVYTFLKTKESLALYDEFSRVLKENFPKKYEELLDSCNEKNWDEECGDDSEWVMQY